MAALPIKEITVEGIPLNIVSGTAGYIRKRAKIYIRGLAAGADTLDLSTYVTGLQGITNLISTDVAGTPGTAKASYSSTTITLNADVSGDTNIIVVGYF
jgi:hypothetical protein